ncbi:MAG: tRNA pseudouridine(55) synthase TruB, partial [Negativibacillus sp.]|nr:tRNA pseudouridine(55) synthase TruB [Negativibacillus sp.]
MDGIIIMDKPEDFTSFDMVAKLRRLLGTRKVGHAGTLDPMATGVLQIFVGRATKCCDLLPNSNKRYTATFELGYTTDTLDATGRVLSRSE